MRQAIFIGVVLLGLAVGVFSALNESLGVQIVMATIGTVVGAAIGGALARVGMRRQAMNASSTADLPGTPDERVSNYWLDHGRLTAAPGLPDPDETDQISLKP